GATEAGREASRPRAQTRAVHASVAHEPRGSRTAHPDRFRSGRRRQRHHIHAGPRDRVQRLEEALGNAACRSPPDPAAPPASGLAVRALALTAGTGSFAGDEAIGDGTPKWAIVDSNHGPPPYQSGAL